MARDDEEPPSEALDAPSPLTMHQDAPASEMVHRDAPASEMVHRDAPASETLESAKGRGTAAQLFFLGTKRGVRREAGQPKGSNRLPSLAASPWRRRV